MPRVSRAQAEAHRVAIETESARLFRERGIRAVSVDDLMAAAGLTRGGFYGHFASKDALAAVACRRAFDQSTDRWRRRSAGQGDGASAFAAIVDGYLSSRNRAAPGSGCPAAALAGDVAREPAGRPVRDAFRDGLAAQVDFLAALDASDGSPPDRARALARLSTMVGALVLARATGGDPLSNEILAAARAHLTDESPRPTAPAIAVRRTTAAATPTAIPTATPPPTAIARSTATGRTSRPARAPATAPDGEAPARKARR